MADQHPQEDAPMTDVDVVKVSKPQKEERSTLTEEHHQHHSSSSSSDDEEQAGEKKKKKKGLKEKIKEKISHEKEEPNGHKDESVPVEKCDEMSKEELTNPEEKKGFLEKLKEKLPGQHKKGEEADHATPTECTQTNIHRKRKESWRR
ncbi:hypothetical protein CK203_069490 [Vitis vinifera]|uniref:Uncharacterized protein n=1 Tax=Vitis vinifera TaxID=29760 RepID=A0A438EKR6_VITVI|nr:hypothetical protein CK203_069490 [Vitis vinifera]